jgi:uncharacterized membrane protein
MKNKRYSELISCTDWLMYIQGEISTDLNMMLGFLASVIIVFLTLMQLSIATGDYSFISVGGRIPIITGLAIQWTFVLVFFLVFIAILVRPKIRLCKKIIKGEITNSDEILKEYNDKVEFHFWWFHKKPPQPVYEKRENVDDLVKEFDDKELKPGSKEYKEIGELTEMDYHHSDNK